jgi:uncharacterized protein
MFSFTAAGPGGPLRVIGAWLALLMGFLAQSGWAQDVQPVPALHGRVLDQTATLSPAQREALAAKLAGLEQQTGAQVVVLMVATTLPEDIAAYAQRVGDAWKLGRKAEGDGVLIVVATQDRKVRIEVAKALEGAIPDLAARQVITTHLAPAFRAGDYAGGLNAAIDALALRIKGEGLPASRASADSTAERFGFEGLAIFMFAAVPVLAVMLRGLLGRKLGALGTAGGSGALAWVFTGSLGLAVVAGFIGLVVALLAGVSGAALGSGRGRSYGGRHAPLIWGSGGGWGGGGGGGGFGSGGGGDFGGGGASGNW